MENDILMIIFKSLGILAVFTIVMKSAWDMSKDGALTAQEVAKLVIIILLIYITIVEASRDDLTQHVFSQGHFMTFIGGVLLLAGIDLPAIKKFTNGNDKPGESKPDKK